MELGFFALLESISPWWWVAFGFALASAEMLVFSFFLMWPAIAAIIMAVVLAIVPEMQGELQVVLFAVLSLALIFVGRRFFQKSEEPISDLNSRTKQLVGKHAVVLSFEFGEGRVEASGLTWPATWPEGQTSMAGEKVTITGADGMSVLVENV